MTSTEPLTVSESQGGRHTEQRREAGEEVTLAEILFANG